MTRANAGPVVDQRHRAGEQPTAREVLRREAAPAPLVLQFDAALPAPAVQSQRGLLALPSLTGIPRSYETPPARIVPALADEGIYLATESSFHRVLHGRMAK